MAQDAAKDAAQGFVWEARKLLAVGAGRHAGHVRGRAAVRQPGHAGLRSGPVAAAAALRSVRAYQAPARRCALLGAGRRDAAGRQPADHAARHRHRACRADGRCGAEIPLSRGAPVRGAVCGLWRFLPVAHPAAGRPVCRRLRPRRPAARRRPDAGGRCRRCHRGGGGPDHVALQHRPSRRAGRDRRRAGRRGGWSRPMSMAAIWPMASGRSASTGRRRWPFRPMCVANWSGWRARPRAG